MKKTISSSLVILLIVMTFFTSSCATVLGGKITSCQTHKEPPRQVRVGWLVADIVFVLVPLGGRFFNNINI